MDKISRRDFLKAIGGGTIAVAGGVLLPGIALSGQEAKEAFTFRAVVGLPTGAIPSYASYVIEGGVNLASKTGVMTKNVFAGPPEAISNLALPGLTRTLQVTDVTVKGSIIEISGEAMDPATLIRGEKPNVTVTIDRSNRTVRTEFLGNELELTLA